MSAHRTCAESQSLTVALSSPPTYWIGLLTLGSSGSRRANTDSTGMQNSVTALHLGSAREEEAQSGTALVPVRPEVHGWRHRPGGHDAQPHRRVVHPDGPLHGARHLGP